MKALKLVYLIGISIIFFILCMYLIPFYDSRAIEESAFFKSGQAVAEPYHIGLVLGTSGQGFSGDNEFSGGLEFAYTLDSTLSFGLQVLRHTDKNTATPEKKGGYGEHVDYKIFGVNLLTRYEFYAPFHITAGVNYGFLSGNYGLFSNRNTTLLTESVSGYTATLQVSLGFNWRSTTGPMTVIVDFFGLYIHLVDEVKVSDNLKTKLLADADSSVVDELFANNKSATSLASEKFSDRLRMHFTLVTIGMYF